MDNTEFQNFRKKLQKTQQQMSQLLAISHKAVQSYEQGWRNIPAHVERQVLLFLALKTETSGQLVPCWEIRGCAPETRAVCPSWEFNSCRLCWFITGTLCQGKTQSSWSKKIILCKKCIVFNSFMNHWSLPSEKNSGEG
jgi:DNA-binding XRE family transcriptional regulator